MSRELCLHNRHPQQCACARRCVYVCVRAGVCVCARRCVYVCARRCVYVCVRTGGYVCVRAGVCVCVCARMFVCAFGCCFAGANGLLVDVCQCCCLLMFVCLPLLRHFPCCKTWSVKNLRSEICFMHRLPRKRHTDIPLREKACMLFSFSKVLFLVHHGGTCLPLSYVRHIQSTASFWTGGGSNACQLP